MQALRMTAAQPRKLAVFPAFHKVAGRRVVVVGQGAAAAAKLRLLAETSADIVLFSPVLDAATGADLIRVGGRWLPRWPDASDVSGAALAFVATGDDATDRAVWALARAAGVPVNVVDKPDLCDFYTPAIVNRAPLAVAIGTDGVAPVLARHVRAKIEALLAPAFGDLAGLADRLRARVAERIASVGSRRRFWAGFFTGPVAAKVFAGKVAEAEDAAVDALARHEKGIGHVSLVGAGPGASDLLTLRAQRLLQEADIVVYDRLVPDDVVSMGRRDAERVYVGKARGAHTVTQAEINNLIVRHAKAGKRVVRLKSGDPLIYGRAGEEIAALREAGISFDIVPGVTAAFAAAAEAEIPLTLRGVSSALVFATGVDADGETLPGWAGVALKGATVAVYMGRAVAGRVAAQLIEAGLSTATPVAVIENASHPGARAFAGRLDELHRIATSAEIRGTVLIIIGEVVSESAILAKPAPLAALAAA
jgi:uroporphyrin-III C-methyltransferase/precorrin-2 dehydrogenase/sirohydrochlorin ferrochelatase